MMKTRLATYIDGYPLKLVLLFLNKLTPIVMT